MLKLRFPLFLIFLCLLAQSCGKFTDKFGRDKTQFTRVNFEPERQGDFITSVPQTGAVVIYFTRGQGEGGMAFGFNNDTEVGQHSVVLPNGNYKVYAYGWSGGSPFLGIVRCGFGNNGNTVSLAGASTSVSINLTQANCQYGVDSDFSKAITSDQSNFDMLDITLCSDKLHPTCTAVTATTASVKVSLFGGEENSSGINESAFYTKTSNCFAFSSGLASTSLRIPIGGTLSPPVKVQLYGGSTTCSTAVSSTYYMMNGGLNAYYNAATGTNVHLFSGASSPYTTLGLFQNF